MAWKLVKIIFLSGMAIYFSCFCSSIIVRADQEETMNQIKQMNSVESLIPFLKDKDPRVRAEAVKALGRLGNPQAVEPLIALLNEEKIGFVYGHVVDSLGMLKDTRAFLPLLNALNNIQFHISTPRPLITIITETADAKLLLPALKANDADVRQAAAAALDKTGWKPVTKNEEIDYYMAKKNWDKCAQLGSTAIDPLVVVLDNIWWSPYHSDIVAALKKINDPRVVDVLIHAGHTPFENKEVQSLAAEVFGEVKDPRAIEPLMRAAEDENDTLRSKAMESLGKMKVVQSQAVLVQALMDKSSTVREAAAKALDDINWKSSDIKENAAYYAAKKDMSKCLELGPTAVDALLLPLAYYSNAESTHFAATTLTKMGASAVEPLIDVLTKINHWEMNDWNDSSGKYNRDQFEIAEKLRPAIAGILGDINDPRAVKILIKAVEDRGDAQSQAIVALGKMKSSQATESLVRLLKDENSRTRKSTAEALTQIGWQPSTDEEKVAFYIAQQDWERCEKLGTIAVESLVALLDVGNTIDDISGPAASVLGKIKDPRAIKPLVYALSKYDVFNDLGPRRSEVLEEALVGFGSAAVDSLIQAFDGHLIAVSSNDLRSLKLNWQNTVNKLIKNGWAMYINPYEVVLTANWPQEKDKVSQVFGNDFKEIVCVFEYEYPNPEREKIAEVFAQIGDKRAIPLLASNLQDWKARGAIADALQKLGWQPGTEREKVYYSINRGDKDGVLKSWESVEKILLEDVGSQDERARSYALYFFISTGKEEVVPKLIDILDTKGTKMLAEAYLNCGHKGLYKAAKDWCLAHGLTIEDGKGNAPVAWGSW